MGALSSSAQLPYGLGVEAPMKTTAKIQNSTTDELEAALSALLLDPVWMLSLKASVFKVASFKL